MNEEEFCFPKLLAVLQAPSSSVSEQLSSPDHRNIGGVMFYDIHLGTIHMVRAVENWIRLAWSFCTSASPQLEELEVQEASD